MLTINISATIHPLLMDLNKPALVDEAAANAAECIMEQVKDNFLKRGGRRFWQQAADSVQVQNLPKTGTRLVTVGQRGVRLQWLGGTVRPTGKPSESTGKPTKSLLVPHPKSPMRENDLSLAEFLQHRSGTVRVIVRKATGRAYLVLDESTRIKLHAAGRTKKDRKAKQATRLTLLGSLLKQVTIPAHPDVMPTDAALHATAHAAAEEVLRNHHLIR